MEKVAIYCRLSDEDRNKTNKFDDSESIQNQKNLLTKYAIEQGWSIYQIYSDDDYSGLDKNRPQFNKMIDDAKRKKFNIILCKHQSRFTRDMELVEKYLHNKFIDWNIRFVSLTDGVDTSQTGGKKARQINGLVNEWYCEDISQSIRSSFKIKTEEGKFIGSFAPYGYKKDTKDKNRLVIDKEASSVVKMIYNLYLQGNGTQHIAYILNEKGIPNPTKYKQNQGLNFVNSSQKDKYGLWNKVTVKRILKNEVYIGNMVQGKRKKVNYKSKKIVSTHESEWVIVEKTHEPIVDENTFLAVQKRMTNKAKSSGKGRTHIFATKLKCMDCGSALNKVTTNGRVYFRCGLYARDPQKKLCTTHSIRLDNLEEVVSEKLRQHIKVLNDDQDFALKIQYKMEFDNKLEVLKKQLQKATNDIEDASKVIKNLYVDKVKGVISEEQFNELNNEFVNEKERLIQTQKKIEREIFIAEEKSNNFDKWVNVVSKYKNFDRLTHIMVSELIDYIEVGEKSKDTKEQKIKIHWLF